MIVSGSAPAFFYLVGRSSVNKVLSRLRRAKSPRYALAMIIGGLYFWSIYFRPRPGRSGGGMAAGSPTMWLVVGTAVLLVLAGLAWFVDSGPSSLALDEAETFFLLPGPVSKRGLVGYKVLRAQMAVLFTVVLWAVLLRRSSQDIVWPLRIVSVWIFFTTTSLHRTGAQLVRAGWAVRGAHAKVRYWVPALVIIAIIGGVAISAGLAYDGIMAGFQASARQGFAAIAHAFDSGPAVVVLWPIQAMVRPMIAATSWTCLLALPGAIAILAAHAVWVASADDQTIDAAVARATETMTRLRNRRQSSSVGAAAQVRPKPNVVLKTLPLRPTGWPATALIWKNLLCMRRKARPTMLVAMCIVPAALAIPALISGRHVAEMIAIAAGGVALMLLVFGPVLVKTDLRSDMANIVALKLMPVRGRTIFAAEVLSVAVPLAIAQTAVMIAGTVAVAFAPDSPVGAGSLALALIGGIPALFVFAAAFVTILNAAPTLFPAWSKLDALKTGGMEAIGQTAIVTMIIVGLLVVLLILPAVIAIGIAAVGRSHLILAMTAGLLVFAGLLGAEVAGLMNYLGGVLERTEPSDVPSS
jgi:hypothetical protein